MFFNLTQFSSGVIFLFGVIVYMLTLISPTHNMVCVYDTIREIAPRLDKLTNKYLSFFRIADKRIKNRTTTTMCGGSLSISNFNFQSVLKKSACIEVTENYKVKRQREKKTNLFISDF